MRTTLKSYLAIALVIHCFLLLLTGCGAGKDPAPGDDSQDGQEKASADEHIVTVGDTVTLNMAARYTANWRSIHDINGCEPSGGQYSSYFVKRQDLKDLGSIMGNNGKGVRIYFGKDTLSDTIRLVLAAVTSNRLSMADLEGQRPAYDFSTPCPSVCDFQSALQDGNCVVSVPRKINKTLIPIKDSVAIDWTRRWRRINSIPGNCSASSSTKNKYYWIDKTVFDYLLGPDSDVNKNRGIRIYFGSPSTNINDPIYLIFIPAVYDVKTRYTEDLTSNRIYIAKDICPRDTCDCTSLLDKD